MLFILQAKEGLISNYGKHLLIVSIVSLSPPSSTKRFSAAMAASVPTSNQWSKLGGSWDPQTFPTRVRKIQIVLYFKRAKDLNGFSPLRFNRKKKRETANDCNDFRQSVCRRKVPSLSLVKIPSKKYFVDDTEDNDVFKERRRKKWEKVETWHEAVFLRIASKIPGIFRILGYSIYLLISGLLCDLLWSDPDKDVQGWGENDRGVSFTFGADVVSKFLNRHDLDLICRAHQVWNHHSSQTNFAHLKKNLNGIFIQKKCFIVQFKLA